MLVHKIQFWLFRVIMLPVPDAILILSRASQPPSAVTG